MTRNARHLVSAVAALVGACAGLAGPAAAHGRLQTETPTAEATTAAPESLTLSFSEGIELRFTTVVVKASNGSAVDTGPDRLAPGNPRMLLVPIAGKLGPGRYTVNWRAVATDGHKTQGTYGFTVAP